MTRGPAWCPCCLLHPAVQCLDAPWLKSIHLDAIVAYSTLPSSSHPYLPTPYSWPVIQWWHSPSKQGSFTPAKQPVIQWRCGPSKQGSFTPAKGLLQLKGRTCDQVGCALGLNGLWPGRISYPAACDLIQPLSGVTNVATLEPNKFRLSWTV